MKTDFLTKENMTTITNVEYLLELIHEELPSYSILIIGRGGVGKSTIGKIIAEEHSSYEYVSVDELIRNMDVDPSVSRYQVYDGETSDPEISKLKKRLVDEMRSIIYKASDCVIFDGMLATSEIEQLSGLLGMLIFVEPDDWNKYKENLRRRTIQDMKDDTRTMGVVWHFIRKYGLFVDTINEATDINDFVSSPEFEEILQQSADANRAKSAEYLASCQHLSPIIYKNVLNV